jgi:hypothetical protein
LGGKNQKFIDVDEKFIDDSRLPKTEITIDRVTAVNLHAARTRLAT